VADYVRLMLDDLAPRTGPLSAGSGATDPIIPRGMPDALSAAVLCAFSAW
jgi:hypothetical protein